MFKILRKDFRAAQRIATCYLKCEMRDHCLFSRVASVPSFKPCWVDFGEIKYKGKCQAFYFNQAIHGSDTFSLWEETNNWFKTHYYEGKPTLEHFSDTIICGLAVLFSANCRKFPKIQKEVTDSIKKKARESPKTFIAESCQKIGILDQELLMALCIASQDDGVFDKYWAKVLIIIMATIEGIEIENNGGIKKQEPTIQAQPVNYEIIPGLKKSRSVLTLVASLLADSAPTEKK